MHYELPCGYHQDFGPERFRLAETLFDHQMVGASQLGKFVFNIQQEPFITTSNATNSSSNGCWNV